MSAIYELLLGQFHRNVVIVFVHILHSGCDRERVAWGTFKLVYSICEIVCQIDALIQISLVNNRAKLFFLFGCLHELLTQLNCMDDFVTVVKLSEFYIRQLIYFLLGSIPVLQRHIFGQLDHFFVMLEWLIIWLLRWHYLFSVGHGECG